MEALVSFVLSESVVRLSTNNETYATHHHSILRLLYGSIRISDSSFILPVTASVKGKDDGMKLLFWEACAIYWW